MNDNEHELTAQASSFFVGWTADELKAALPVIIGLTAYHEGDAATLSTLQNICEGLVGKTMAEVTNRVAHRHGTSVSEMRSMRLAKSLGHARDEAWFILRSPMTKYRSLKEIGLWFGGRDHTSILAGALRFEDRRK